MRERLGVLKPTRVVRDSSAQVVIAVSSATTGEMKIEFNMDARQEARLESIGVATFGPPPAASNRQMSSADRGELVERVARVLLDNYVFPEVARKMAEKVRGAVQAGEYNALVGEGAMAARLTEDLRSVSRDRHLGVVSSPKVRSAEARTWGRKAATRAALTSRFGRWNTSIKTLATCGWICFMILPKR